VRISRTTGSVIIALSLLTSACGGGSDGGTKAGAAAATKSSNGIPNPTGARSIVVGLPSQPGFTDIPLLETQARLNKDGWNIQTQIIEDQSLQTEALLADRVQLTRGAPLATLTVADKGASLRLIAEGGTNDWIVVGNGAVTSCADLGGKRVAYQSESSVSTLMLRTFVDSCSAKPKYLLMAGSANRAAALIGNRIDATIVQVADWVNATTGKTTQAHLVSNVAKDVPDLATNTYAANQTWAEKNKDLLAAFLANLLVVSQELNADKDAIVAAAGRYLPDDKPEAVRQVIDSFQGVQVFQGDGGLTSGHLDYTLNFFKKAKSVSDGLTVDKIAYREPLDAALALVQKRS
jgi:ABC-type nitrate/sulfonate/bicarbonate transport system substrate-binding protein